MKNKETTLRDLIEKINKNDVLVNIMGDKIELPHYTILKEKNETGISYSELLNSTEIYAPYIPLLGLTEE